MAPLDPDAYLKKLGELRRKHAWETLNKAQTGGRPLGEAYSYAIGFQSGLNEAEKLLQQILTEAEQDFS